MYDFTYSYKFVDKFKKRGFTTLSLCMAMESEIRYNPETGKRLPSFILVDRPALRRWGPEGVTLTEQVPYDVPTCFRNAQPLHDCKLTFDMMTGKRLTSQQSRELRHGKGYNIWQLSPNWTTHLPNAKKEDIIATRVDSRLLPKGKGYVLYNGGPAGPEASNGTLKIVLRRPGT